MPSYKLEHGLASGTVNCGSVVINQSGPNNTTKVMANPPGGGAPQDITSETTFNSPSGNGTLMNPVANDTINFGTYTVSIGPPPSPVVYGFSSNATYQVKSDTQKAGYFKSTSLTAAADDWDAEDSGTPEP